MYGSAISITGNDAPSLTIEDTTGTNNQINSQNNGAWTSNSNTITWTPNNNIYTISVHNNGNITGTALNLELAFNNTSSNTANEVLVWKSGNENVAGISASNTATSLLLDFKQKGLQLSGSLGLNINFGTDTASSSNKSIQINNLSNLEGNLTIYGGTSSNTFNVNIGTMKGNIVFGLGGIDSDHGTINITKSLEGNMITTADLALSNTITGNGGDVNSTNGVKINFTGGATMTGSILGRTNGLDGIKKTITFDGSANNSTAVLTGNIISYGPSSINGTMFSRSSGNHVTFTKGSMVGSIIATNSSVNYYTGKKGYNNITFNSTSTQTLTGGILAHDYNNNGDLIRAVNTLNINANTTLEIKANTDGNSNTINDSTRENGRDFTLTTGSIIARGYGVNEVNLANSSTLTLDGAIITEGNAKSIITFTETNSTINGNITTSGGTATISIADSVSGNVNGEILANGGSNYITMNGSTSATFTATTATATSGGNRFSLNNTTQNTLKLTDIVAQGGNNYIAKGIDGNTAINTFTASWATDTYKALGSLEATNITSTSGANYINVASITSTGAINANGSGASNKLVANTLTLVNITAKGDGANNIIANTNGTFTLSGTITAGELANEGTSSGINYIYLNGSNTTNINALSAISGTNYVSAESTSTALSFSTISASNGNNYIGKSILTNSSGSITTASVLSNINELMSDTYAVSSGTLSITNGILSSGTGVNTIALVASNSISSTIINGDEIKNNAISGNANIYLNVNASGIGDGITAIKTYLSNNNYRTLSDSAVIAGNIIASDSTNVKIIGTSNAATTQMGILGNITNNNGTTNIVLVDSFFAPSEMIVTSISDVSPASLSAPVTIGGTNAGNITTASGAITNIATRFTASPAGNEYSIYNVNNQGSAKTNIAIQGDFKVGANIIYGGSYDGEVNMIFASANNIVVSPTDGSGNVATDTFTTMMTDPSQTNGTQINSTDTKTGRIAGVTYSDGLILTLRDKSVKIGDGTASFINTYRHYFTETNNGYTSTFTLDRSGTTDIITIQGLVLGSVSPLTNSNSRTFNVAISENSAFVGSVVLPVAVNRISQVAITMNQGAKLLTDSEILYVKSLKLADSNTFNAEGLSANTFAQNNTTIDLATMGNDLNNITTREQFRLFAVGSNTSGADTGLQGNNALFRVYVNDDADQTKDTTTLGGYQANSGTNGYVYSDRIVIVDIGDQTNSATRAQTHYLQIVADANTDLKSIRYNTAQNGGRSGNKGGTAIAGNIAVATVKNENNITSNNTHAIVEFGAQDTIQGFDQVTSGLLALETDQYGMTGTGSTGWTTYFVNSMSTKGATEERAEASAATLATNYDLYMANFNSLNKRMGELRNNDNSQGAWARIFNGSQTNDFGLGTKTNYTTFQAGYDYAIGMEGSNNYIGLAVSYSMSSSEVQTSLTQALDNNIVGFNNVKSSAVEVALYNSYVQDEGWYNDSIFKFSYIMSDFNILGQDTTYNTSNMAFILSDEFGYRFKLGNDKEWYIDPQAEVSLGYFDQTELKQTLGSSWLNTLADSVITMRSRFGSSFGYDFKKFTANKPIKASVYVGAFYEYDYVTGGDVTLTTNLGGESSTSGTTASDGRVVMNLGTNMTVKDNTRIYFDFEKSFGGDITTDYQVNLGVRYSFGESNGYTPAVAKAKEVAPLKVEEVKNTQENQAQESKTTQESK